MAYGGGAPFPEYVSAAERRRRAERKLAALRREGRAPSPVVVEGRELATTFWGKAWCDHLESLADLATRLPRGRSYVRGGAVIDLRIARGEVRALVSGTEVYEVLVRVVALAARRWRAVRAACAGRIATVVELLAGQLSSAVMAVLCDRERGIFPAARELDLDCSCPDHARLCKHLAAVLYGVCARLDRAPELLFTLRGVDLAELVADAATAGALAGDTPGRAALPRERLGEIFGIELEPPAARSPRERSETRPRSRRRGRSLSAQGRGRSLRPRRAPR